MHKIKILPSDLEILAPDGENLLHLLRKNGLSPDAPCGGQGTCGKCTVWIDEKPVRACQVTVRSDLTVTIPESGSLHILAPERAEHSGCTSQNVLAGIDIGTTSVVCTLLDGETEERIHVRSAPNPQAVFGADVVTRIRAALSGELEEQTRLIRECVSGLIQACCRGTGIEPEVIKRVCIVGNPAMQQLFLGISPENLVQIPFCPILKKSSIRSCGQILPVCADAELFTVPDISGYVGADTMGCILASEIYRGERMTLLVDIGTNGEMVLGNRNRMIACATAAGPALEGANIRFGMRSCRGAIDHVWLENGKVRISTIGDAAPLGICGSGLIDAVAVFLELGLINDRGRISPGCEKDGERILYLTEEIWLTQEDIRQVQLAKGAIRAGIELMTWEMGIAVGQIDQCLLAGAFGSFIAPESACRIGLLPPALLPKIRAVGNAASAGADLIAIHPRMLRLADALAETTEYLELASMGEFPRAFAAAMRF